MPPIQQNPMKSGTDHDPHEAFLRVWSDSGWAGDAKHRERQSIFFSKMKSMDAHCIPHLANREHVRAERRS